MKGQIRTFIIFIIVLAALGFYAVVPFRLTYAEVVLRKISLPLSHTTPALSTSSTTSANTTPHPTRPAQQGKARPVKGKVRILFFGDSMLEELSRRLDDYVLANGYTMQTVIWYGSTTEKWGMTQTLRHLIDEYKPSYLWICLGGNELFVRNLEERDAYIKLLMSQMGSLPFVWIGPPCWKKDTGINDLIRRNVGDGQFFDSSKLQLKRKADGRHPNHEAAARWGDEVALWMQSRQCSYPLTTHKPQKPGKCPVRLLQPSFEGFQ